MEVVEMTRQRQIVLSIVRRPGEHLTADGIFQLAREQMPSIAMGTVYRNLGQLAACGEIRRIPMPDGADRYDGNTCPHEHITCTRCGRVVDVHLGDLAGYIEQHSGIKVSSYELTINGICPMCRES